MSQMIPTIFAGIDWLSPLFNLVVIAETIIAVLTSYSCRGIPDRCSAPCNSVVHVQGLSYGLSAPLSLKLRTHLFLVFFLESLWIYYPNGLVLFWWGASDRLVLQLWLIQVASPLQFRVVWLCLSTAPIFRWFSVETVLKLSDLCTFPTP